MGLGKKCVEILYLNHRGETATRTIIPRKVWFGSTKWHEDKQWLLHAFDAKKGETRDFAMADILKWGN